VSNHGKRYRKEMAAGFIELQEIVDFCFILRVEEGGGQHSANPFSRRTVGRERGQA